MKINSRLKELRLKANLSQTELAEQIGFARSSICDWEVDVSTMSVDKALKFCEFFNVSPNYFFYAREDEFAENIIDKIIRNTDKETLIKFLIEQLKKKN